MPFPVNGPGLAAFVASLYIEGLAAGTVKSYLAAVCHAQIAVGLGDPHECYASAGKRGERLEEDGRETVANPATHYAN